MFYIRAALVLAVGALAAGCGAEGTTTTSEPAAIASVRVTTTPTSASPSTVEPSKAAEPSKTAETSKAPTVVNKQVVQFQTIPFKKKTVTDDSLAKGERTIRTTGVNGTRRLTYRVTIVNGVQTAKHLVKQEVSKQPRTQVTVVGTKVEEPVEQPTEEAGSGCDPNYSGCVPIASDVDCSGGSGNGPEYVAGPVDVIGSDIYRLDADHDGVGCED